MNIFPFIRQALCLLKFWIWSDHVSAELSKWLWICCRLWTKSSFGTRSFWEVITRSCSWKTWRLSIFSLMMEMASSEWIYVILTFLSKVGERKMNCIFVLKKRYCTWGSSSVVGHLLGMHRIWFHCEDRKEGKKMVLGTGD